MKLRSCHIDNFGKLSDLHLEFQDGVNLFHEPNAWGKSTLAAFLRVMFYGFDSKRESGLFDKERVVFRPWQGGTYGGELDFSYQGKEYRISRTFGKTEKTDVFHLYDLSTNLECHDFFSSRRLAISSLRILLSSALPRSEVKFSDSTVHPLKGAHLLHKTTANAARQMRSMPSWEIL